MTECYFCKGQLVKRSVRSIREMGSEIVILEDVPALVCGQCGEKYYEGHVLATIDELLKNPIDDQTVSVPVIAFPGSLSGITA